MVIRKSLAFMVLATLISAGLAGCIANDSNASNGAKTTLTIAYYLAEDSSADANAIGMAERLEKDLGINVKLYDVSSEGMIIQALRFGNADIGFMEGGPAWIAWQEYDLEVLAVETTTSSNDTYYNAAAWVLANSTMAQYYLDDDETTDPFAALEGKTSCHTGWLKSAGMLMPMGYLIGNGYVTPVGDGDDINSLRDTINAHFDGSTGAGNPASIPEGGGLYSGYSGALECLSEGYGDVAFAKGDEFSTVHKYCDNTDSADNEDWCLPLDQYIQLPAWGSSPSHPMMYNPETIADDMKNEIQSAMLAWNDEIWVEDFSVGNETYTGCYNAITHLVLDIEKVECGSEILSTMTSKGYGIATVSTEQHLGSYSNLLSAIPGLSKYYHDEKYGITEAENQME